MTDDPQTASITARRRPLLLALLAGLGSAAAIGIMEWLSVSADYPLAIIPFATSIVLVIGLPDAEPSQPRALVGGHLVATIAGLVVVKLAGPSAWAAAVAVGLAVAAMMLTGTMHPPAGINPLLVVINNLSWPFLLMPVLAGALLLAAFAFAWHRLSGRSDWPRRWW
jgi:CBS-domain-containing membrane protein